MSRSKLKHKPTSENFVDGRTLRYVQHREKRKIELLDQTTLLLAKHGLRELTIDVAAQKLGLAKPALYRYFRSKDDLIQSTLTHARTSIIEADIQADIQDWRLQLYGAIRFVAQKPEAFIVLHRHAANDPKYNPHFDLYFKQVKQLTATRLLKFSAHNVESTISHSFFSKALTTTILSATQTWIDDGLWDVDVFHNWLVNSIVSLTETWSKHTFTTKP